MFEGYRAPNPSLNDNIADALSLLAQIQAMGHPSAFLVANPIGGVNGDLFIPYKQGQQSSMTSQANSIHPSLDFGNLTDTDASGNTVAMKDFTGDLYLNIFVNETGNFYCCGRPGDTLGGSINQALASGAALKDIIV